MYRFSISPTLVPAITLMLLAGAIGAQAQAVQLEASSRALEIRGATAGERFGRPMVCVDLDGDGADEMVIGADKSYFLDGSRPTLYIFRGGANFARADLIDLATDSADAVVLGESGSDNLASSLAAGDVNGDGYEDLLATDSTLTVSGRTYAGAAYVVFGSPDFFQTATYDLAAGDWDVKILGAAAGDDLGAWSMFLGAVSTGLAGGDLDGDGVADIAVGAHLADSNGRSDSGALYVIFGDPGFSSGTTIDLASQADVTILANQTGNELGSALAIADVNGDRIGDLVAGYYYGSSGAFTSEGRVLVFYGSGSWPSTINLASVNPDLRILGATAGDELGWAVAAADVDGDGVSDILGAANAWNSDAGAVYGVYGGSGLPSEINLASTSPGFFVQGTSNAHPIGDSVVSGDFDGDRIGDFMYASRDGERPGYNGEGRTFIILGKTGGIDSLLQVAGDEADLIINGGVNGFQLGDFIASGDVDGDGADEILIAAPFVDSVKGRVLVFDLNPVTAVRSHWSNYR